MRAIERNQLLHVFIANLLGLLTTKLRFCFRSTSFSWGRYTLNRCSRCLRDIQPQLSGIRTTSLHFLLFRPLEFDLMLLLHHSNKLFFPILIYLNLLSSHPFFLLPQTLLHLRNFKRLRHKLRRLIMILILDNPRSQTPIQPIINHLLLIRLLMMKYLSHIQGFTSFFQFLQYPFLFL